MRIKEVEKLIGKKNMKLFSEWMYGQTVSAYPNGEINYYEHDVMAFKTKLDTGYDRQDDPGAWD